MLLDSCSGKQPIFFMSLLPVDLTILDSWGEKKQTHSVDLTIYICCVHNGTIGALMHYE
jgi:hypothetical protein